MGHKFTTGCTAKERFRNFKLACKAARRFNKKITGKIVEPYYCRECGGFHVGKDGAPKTTRLPRSKVQPMKWRQYDVDLS